MNVAGNVAVVTGPAGGIGQGPALAFSATGTRRVTLKERERSRCG